MDLHDSLTLRAGLGLQSPGTNHDYLKMSHLDSVAVILFPSRAKASGTSDQTAFLKQTIVYLEPWYFREKDLNSKKQSICMFVFPKAYCPLEV